MNGSRRSKDSAALQEGSSSPASRTDGRYAISGKSSAAVRNRLLIRYDHFLAAQEQTGPTRHDCRYRALAGAISRDQQVSTRIYIFFLAVSLVGYQSPGVEALSTFHALLTCLFSGEVEDKLSEFVPGSSVSMR